ncbi:hypothetical protein [Solidesulfovibrio sp.]
MDEKILQKIELLLNNKIDTATIAIICAMALIFLCKVSAEAFLKYRFDKKKDHASELNKLRLTKKQSIFEHYFNIIYETQGIAASNIRDASIQLNSKRIRPHQGDHILYLERKEIVLLHKIADHFMESHNNQNYNILQTEQLVQDLKKCLSN